MTTRSATVMARLSPYFDLGVQASPDLVATGNIGCIAQIASGTSIPVLHTIELLDFAHGGPTPDGLASLTG
jgi:Fe-S oxidoreductase